MSLRPLAAALFALLTLAALSAGQAAAPAGAAAVPLGIQGFTFDQPPRRLYLIATASGLADSPPEPASRLNQAPRRLNFRVTASALEELIGVDLDPLTLPEPLNPFLLHLGFRLKVFHGIETAEFAPAAVEMLGEPAELESDERVYLASFTLPPVPAGDRLVFEVLMPGGERLCKFPLNF